MAQAQCARIELRGAAMFDQAFLLVSAAEHLDRGFVQTFATEHIVGTMVKKGQQTELPAMYLTLLGNFDLFLFLLHLVAAFRWRKAQRLWIHAFVFALSCVRWYALLAPAIATHGSVDGDEAYVTWYWGFAALSSYKVAVNILGILFCFCSSDGHLADKQP